MEATVSLMFGIHSHQPVGNFEHVFKKAYDECYSPFLRTLSEHPGIRASLHFSGSLLEWIEEHEPEYIDLIARLAERGQVELLSGGFYEPILPIIPREDALGQIQMMNDYIRRRFGQKASGLWLTERVWEPSLPSLMAEAGLSYTLVDDTHFIYAGLRAEDMFGYYFTEDEGKKTAVFPIDKTLRYYIPFKLPEDTVAYLRQVAGGGRHLGVTYGDDAEKFGVWPETHAWVYGEKYLERLFSAIEENADWIRMPTFSEFMETHPPMGRMYLPTASYDEMMEWAMTAERIVQYQDIVDRLKADGTYASCRPFIRGGFWRNFLAKYPEANRMHKKMLHVSRKVSAMSGRKTAEARRELWRGQCNCPYWHGLFGGLYLNYLRYANYHHLLKAECLADQAGSKRAGEMRVEQLDYDCDGSEEIIVTNPTYSVYVAPAYGGSIAEIDYRPKFFHLTDVMGRHREAYHRKISRAQVETGAERVQSIHDLLRVKEKGLESLLHYDRHERRSFLDHFLSPETALADFAAAEYREEGDFIDQPYQLAEPEIAHKEITCTVKRDGHLLRAAGPVPVSIAKHFTISSAAGIETAYHVRCGDKAAGPVIFAVELNLTLLSGDAEDRCYEVPGRTLENNRMNSLGILDSVSEVRLVDGWMKIAVVLDFEPAATLWRFPVETVSQSESGFERTYQGSCILAVWPMTLEAGDTVERTVHLKVEDL